MDAAVETGVLEGLEGGEVCGFGGGMEEVIVGAERSQSSHFRYLHDMEGGKGRENLRKMESLGLTCRVQSEGRTKKSAQNPAKFKSQGPFGRGRIQRIAG